MSSGFLEPSDDDTIEIELRSRDEIARRVVVLASLVRRAAMEASAPDVGAGEQDAFERETDRFELYSWAVKELGDSATADELSLLRAPAGALLADDIDQCLAASGPAQALRWSLGALDRLAPEDTPDAFVETLLAWCPGPWDEISRFGRRFGVRGEDEIASERERWELWHWRAALDHESLEPGESIDEVLSIVADEAAAADLIHLADGDFAVDGVPFHGLSEGEQTRVADISEGYLLALNWVCGFGDSWDDVPLYPE